MSCKQPRERVCSLRFPKAENPKKNPWIDHINREARRLGISYMSAVGDARVKASYKKPLRLKKKKVVKGPSVDEELEQIEQEEQQEQNFPSPPRSPIPTRKQQPKSNTTKKTMKALLEMSPIKTPDFSKLKKPDTTKKTMKALLEMSPIKTPDFSKFRTKKIPKFKAAATPPRKNPESIIRNPKTRVISRKLVEK